MKSSLGGRREERSVSFDVEFSPRSNDSPGCTLFLVELLDVIRPSVPDRFGLLRLVQKSFRGQGELNALL